MSARGRGAWVGAACLGSVLALGVALPGCGRDEAGGPETAPSGSGGTGGTAGTAGAPVFVSDEGPWSDEPAGEPWELAGWLPKDDRVNGYHLDLARLRAHRAPFRTSNLWSEAAAARRRWVRELGLPEAALGDVIAGAEPLRFQACRPVPPGPAILDSLRARGYREQDLGGALVFVAPDADAPGVAWIDGRLVFGPYETAAFERLAAVRAGRAPSARDMPGVRAGCAAVGAGGFAEIEAFLEPKRRGPPGAPPLLASVGRYRMEGAVFDVRALVMASEADRDAFRASVERMLSGVPLPPGPPITLGARGAVLRVVAPSTFGRSLDAEEGGVRSDLRALAEALERFAAERGALPSAAEGLGALAQLPSCLDELLGDVPVDPWGRPFAYQPGHPKRPGSFVLRSLGPDGEIDTEDDVLPE